MHALLVMRSSSCAMQRHLQPKNLSLRAARVPAGVVEQRATAWVCSLRACQLTTYSQATSRRRGWTYSQTARDATLASTLLTRQRGPGEYQRWTPPQPPGQHLPTPPMLCQLWRPQYRPLQLLLPPVQVLLARQRQHGTRAPQLRLLKLWTCLI